MPSIEKIERKRRFLPVWQKNFKKAKRKWIIFLVLGYTVRMIKPTKNIKDVKQMVRACAEQRVAVKVNLGRNKSVSYSGILSGIYPALFTVKPDDENFLGKTAYSYSDVLCGTVKIRKI